MSSYDIKIWNTREYKGKKRTTYRVRWTVAGEEFGETFIGSALAESFRSKLITNAREGVPFDEVTGLPEPMARELKSRSWYQHACDFVDMKWPRASGKHRKSIADALATVTPALLAGDRGAPNGEVLRAALYGWAFNSARRAAGPPPAEFAPVIKWVEANTVRLTALSDPALARKALDTISLKLDGKQAAPTTIARKRAVFSGALSYAIELRLLPTHPLTEVNWTAPKSEEEVDLRVVANPEQIARLLAGVAEDTPELEAFFAAMAYSALRPEEVIHVRVDQCELPDPSESDAWGWWHLDGATVAVGEAWTDSGERHEHRSLKHRSKRATRDVPIPPEEVEILRRHIGQFRPGPGGLMFATRRGPGGRYFPNLPGTPIPNNTYTTVWARVRKRILSPAEAASPVARRPYDLRHACLSLWLAAGVAATRIATWAGNSVAVLMRVYAKCIFGQVDLDLKRIRIALTGYQPGR